MNRAINAYNSASTHALGPRSAEAEALRKAARLLERAAAGDGIDEAVAFTRKLWSIIQADLMANANSRPPALAANLVSLSAHIDRQMTTLSGGDVSVVAGVVDIHRNLALGLEGVAS